MSAILDEVLQECVAPLRPYLSQLVVVGGWVPYLYTKVYEGAVAHAPLLTADFDVALARREFIEGEVTLDTSILDSGFSYDFASLDKPPVVRYVKSMEFGRRAEIEFIIDAGRSESRVEIIGSINAQALRHIDLLVANPTSHPLTRFGMEGDEALRLPRPSMFALHKVLVAPRRPYREKTAKDLYYAFYVLDSFPQWKEGLLNEAHAFARVSPERAAIAATYLESMFEDIGSDGVSLLLSQRPQTAYRLMSENQFRRYALHRMRELLQSLQTE